MSTLPPSPVDTKIHLRSLAIRRYEQFQDCPPIEFSPGENLILGINGAGKTKLLQLIEAVSSFRYGTLVARAFDIAFDIGLGLYGFSEEISIRGEVQNEPPESRGARSLSTQIAGERAPYLGLRMRLRIDAGDRGSLDYRVERGRGTVQRDQDEHDLGAVDPSFLLSGLFDFFLQQASSRAVDDPDILGAFVDGPCFLRETADDFTVLVEHLPYEWEDSRMAWKWSDASPWMFGLLVYLHNLSMQRDGHGVMAPIICTRDTSFAPLLDALGAEHIAFRFKIVREDIHRPRYFEGRGIEIRVRFRSGTEVVGSELTFGQKRLITLAMLARFSTPQPLLIDEIDNGLHPAWVEAAMGFIENRQSFLASHDRLVIDLLDYESAEDLQRKIHICHRSEDGNQRLAQLSDADAREVYEKIDIGIMHPSDVLLAEGLW